MRSEKSNKINKIKQCEVVLWNSNASHTFLQHGVYAVGLQHVTVFNYEDFTTKTYIMKNMVMDSFSD